MLKDNKKLFNSSAVQIIPTTAEELFDFMFCVEMILEISQCRKCGSTDCTVKIIWHETMIRVILMLILYGLKTYQSLDHKKLHKKIRKTLPKNDSFECTFNFNKLGF